jgi:hypothetical protein
MDGGLIVRMGTYAEVLTDPGGLHRRLCARQFGETGSAALPPIPTLRSDPGAGIGIAAAGPRRRTESGPSRARSR